MVQKSWIAILAVIALTMCGVSEARENGGVIYYTLIEGQVHVLLADHKGGGAKHSQRGWAGFGGRGCASDTAETVAKREGGEELKCILSNAEISATFQNAPSHKKGNFTTYFAKLDFIDSSILTLRKNPGDCSGGGERGPYAWVAWETLNQDINAAKLHAGKYQLTIKRDNSERIYPVRSSSVYYNEFISALIGAMENMQGFPFQKFHIASKSPVREIHSKD